MPDTSSRDVLKIGDFVGEWSFICKVSNVNNGGTIAISGTWAGLPDEQNFSFERVMSNKQVMNKTGGPSAITTRIIGFKVTSMFNQRDADAFEFDATYAGAECIFLSKLHYFGNLASPKLQWLAVFGTVEMHAAAIKSEDGYIPFTFIGMTNAQAIDIVKTADAASGKVTAPVLTGFTQPSATITIPAHAGKVGIYKISDLTP
jgi:hypothetical protein